MHERVQNQNLPVQDYAQGSWHKRKEFRQSKNKSLIPTAYKFEINVTNSIYESVLKTFPEFGQNFV